jgi:hypothetical protein
LAGIGLLVVAGALPAMAASAVHAQGDLTDLRAAVDPTDGATAIATGARQGDQTVVVLNIKGIDPAAAGRTFGAHVHVGVCVAGDGAAALGHYNHGGGVSEETEVWLDFTVTSGGTGHATAVVPFAIPEGGAAAIVIHENPTDPSGAAGARIACIGVDF